MYGYMMKAVDVGRRALASRQGGILSSVPILDDHLSLFFVQATIILGITRSLSFLGTYLKQPKVIFEIIGGILMGPSAIGRKASFLEIIFPAESLDYLDLVANIGLTLYLFLVGLELDPKLLKTHARKAGGIALIGMAVPFALGVAISRIMFDVLQGDDPAFKDVDFVSFFVFIGTAMSITAFPVLARLLKEGGLIYTSAGAMAMGAAALNDAVAWCLLTLAISIANAGNMATAGYIFLCVVGFALCLFFVIKPLFEELVTYVEAMHRPDMHQNLFVLTLVILFMSAWTTALLGVHAIFGAFLFGLIVPRGSHLFKECNERMEELVLGFTLPLYFALSGLKTDVTTISTGKEGAICVLVCVCATAGKFIGAGGTALVSGMGYRESAVIAALMNTRGLVELIVLNLGMSSGILNTRTFSVMVIMCLFTTFLTSPLVEWIYPREMRTVEHKDDASSVEGDGTVEDVHMPEMSVDRYNRMVMVVDQVAELQAVVNTLTYVSATTHHTPCITALHFIEPTNSKHDEFLALNSRGKLIRIDEESTDIACALRHEKSPELLPLSVYCKALQMPCNAFRIQGDPDEFPTELRTLSKSNEAEIIFMPWKPSHYLQKFIWHSLTHIDLPTVLVVCNEVRAVRSDSIDGEEGRKRTGSDEMPQTKPRSNSLVGKDNSYAKVPHLEEQPLYTNLPAETLPAVRRGTIKATISKLSPAARTANVVVAVLLGELADVVMLSLLLRMAKHNAVRVCLPKDWDCFSQHNLDAFQKFRRTAQDDNLGVVVHDLESNCDDHEGIYDELQSFEYDLLLLSYVQPSDDGTQQASPERGRSMSISLAFNAHHPALDPMEARIQTGMPAACLHSKLAHPELGQLGSLVQEGKHNKPSMVLVFHEHVNKAKLQRAMSLRPQYDVPTAEVLPTTAVQIEMVPADKGEDMV